MSEGQDNFVTLGNEAQRAGKASFMAWSWAQRTGEDPLEVERRTEEYGQQKRLAYSAYVRDNEPVADSSEIQKGEKKVSQVDFTFEDIKQLLDQRLTVEREYTRELVQSETGIVRTEVGELRTEVGELRTEVGELHTKVGGLSTEVGELRTEVGELHTKVGGLSTEVISLHTKVGTLQGELHSFINHNFEALTGHIDQRFDRVEDHLDHLDIDVATLRTDVRHVKQALRTRDVTAPAAA